MLGMFGVDNEQLYPLYDVYGTNGKVPSQELLELCVKLRKDRFGNDSIGVLQLYFDHGGDMGLDTWKFKVFLKKDQNIILISHIFPDDVTEHNHILYLAVSAIGDAYDRGLADGKVTAVSLMAKMACDYVGVKKSKVSQHLERIR